MSADNWTICPRCRSRKQAKAFARLDRVKAMYGQFDADEFTAEVTAAQADIVAAADFHEQTFREDYEISGAGEGVVTVGYSGSCGACGLTLTFTDDHPIPGVTT